MQAPQSQSESVWQVRRSQWWRPDDAALQTKFRGQSNPSLHEMSLQPWASVYEPAAHRYPAGHAYPSVAQLAGAQPCASAAVLVGAHTVAVPQVNPAVHGFGPQWPFVPQTSSAAHELAVHGSAQ